MLKTLVRKQMTELLSPIMIDRKKGQRRSKGKVIAFALLFIFCFLCLAFAFVGLSALMAEYLLSEEGPINWLYFTLAGIMTLVLGIFGSIFATYSMLYQARDNEQLLAMPIPASTILISRMISVFFTGMLFASLVWLPAVGVYAVVLKPGVGMILLSLLMLVVFSLIILALSCFLGWVVAMIASRLRSKNVAITLLSILGVGFYYYLSFNLQSLLEGLLQRGDILAENIRVHAWPLYELSQAAMGNLGAFLLWLGFALLLAGITWFILTKTFDKIVTMKKGAKRVEYKEEKATVRSADSALLRKEFKRFTSMPAYMLNCGLGVLLIPALGVVLLIKKNDVGGLIQAVSMMWPAFTQWLPLILAAVIGLVTTMNDMAAPSISVEAKNLWIVRSMPVDTVKFLMAKVWMSVILTLPFTLFSAIVCTFVFPMEGNAAILLIAFAILVAFFNAAFGLALNLKFPNLNWVNETAAVKTGASVALAIFGGWVLIMIAGAGGYLLSKVMAPNTYFAIVVAVMALATAGLLLYITKRGPKIIEEL